jgi:hypothetical protein
VAARHFFANAQRNEAKGRVPTIGKLVSLACRLEVFGT